MILFIICTLLKKYYGQNWKKELSKKSIFFKVNIHKASVILFITYALLSPTTSNAQYSMRNYKVLFEGNNIGWLRLEKNTDGSKSDLSLVSEVKAKVVFPITIFSKESSTFESGKLIYSSQLRKTNGTVKFDMQTRFVDDQYQVVDKGEKAKLSFSFIGTNLLNLYFQEPRAFNTVYCDKLQRFVKIVKTDDGGYKLKFPNGNSNCYYYKDGVCIKVKIQHAIYSAEIIINP